MVWRWLTAGLSLALLLVAPVPSRAADPLVISIWGGNWKDTVEKIVAKPFTAKTGIPVEFEVGGTLDRLAKARVAKAAPLVDITFTTTHVGRLYISDGLFGKLDMAKLPNSKDLAKEALRSDSHIGTWAYVYTIAYRPDQVQGEITKWADLWEPRLKGKVDLELVANLGVNGFTSQNLIDFEQWFIPLLKEAKARGLTYRVEQCPMPGWTTADSFHNNLAYTPGTWIALHRICERHGVGDHFRIHYDPSHAILMGQDSRSIFQYLRDAGYAFLIGGFHVKGQVIDARGVAAWGYGGQTIERGDRVNGAPSPRPADRSIFSG